MRFELQVPTVGESVTEAMLGKWLKQPGDAVRRDEPLVEIESEKATVEISAPADGVLRVKAFWPEAGIRLTKARIAKLEAELNRLARFAACERVEFLPGWQRDFLPPL